MLILLSDVKSQVQRYFVMSALFDMTSHAVLHVTDLRVGMFV